MLDARGVPLAPEEFRLRFQRIKTKMAGKKAYPVINLREFKGSKEEKMVQKMFQVITTYPSFVRFINLEIHNCNAEDGTSFSDAYITLQTTYESMRRQKTDFVTDRPKCEGVEMKDMLNIKILEKFQEGGVDVIENYDQPGVSQAFNVLLNFLREIKSHEIGIWKSIDTASTTSKETLIVTGMAHHLFSRLVPDMKYEVDQYAKELPKTCVCGCNSSISEGDTSLGSLGTWHGRVDIMVNDTIAVAIGKEPSDYTEEDDDEPQKKQRKIETDQKCDIRVDVKRHSSVLLDLKVLNQILAEAITNGFAQVKKNRSSLSDFLIPTFGATADHISLCLYDPINDCLLHIFKELKLWINTHTRYKLNPETIIIIWLFLNFTSFTKKNLASAADLKKSGLHEHLKEDLYYYREAKEKCVLQPPDGPPWEMTSILVKHPNN
ncbi:uncharacterized protein [Argopecten irradians]|uniref:uncharacterized protein n=1 Tax=Argopecten irradians TaxID=31199 RepID=UPI003712355D